MIIIEGANAVGKTKYINEMYPGHLVCRSDTMSEAWVTALQAAKNPLQMEWGIPRCILLNKKTYDSAKKLETEGSDVVLDRSWPSTVVYQFTQKMFDDFLEYDVDAFGKKYSFLKNADRHIEEMAYDDIIIIDAPASVCRKRIKERGEPVSKLKYLEAMRDRYLALADSCEFNVVQYS